jgi:antitoxin PrlF
MKTTATLTSKGQITIPRVVRRLFGLQTGDALEFDVQEGKVQLRPARPKRLSAGVLKAHLPKGWKPPTVQEMDAGIARHLTDKHSGQ